MSAPKWLNEVICKMFELSAPKRCKGTWLNRERTYYKTWRQSLSTHAFRHLHVMTKLERKTKASNG